MLKLTKRLETMICHVWRYCKLKEPTFAHLLFTATCSRMNLPVNQTNRFLMVTFLIRLRSLRVHILEKLFTSGESIHRSHSDKLAVVHSSCLFGAESYSGQRERKSDWQGFQSKNCELVSGKLSIYIHSYTHLRTSSALNECLLVHNFQNNCSTECHW